MKPKLVYVKFQVDFIKKFNLIVQSTDDTARTDAYNILNQLYGASARIIGQGKTIKRLPADVEPVKCAREWAWYQF